MAGIGCRSLFGLRCIIPQPIQCLPLGRILRRELADQLQNRIPQLLEQRGLVSPQLLAEFRVLHEFADHLRDALSPHQARVGFHLRAILGRGLSQSALGILIDQRLVGFRECVKALAVGEFVPDCVPECVAAAAAGDVDVTGTAVRSAGSTKSLVVGANEYGRMAAAANERSGVVLVL